MRINRFGLFCYRTDEPPSGGAPAAPVEPVVEAPPAPVEPVAAGDAPWAQELATVFPDEAVRTEVDSFLRGRVQPHVTQLEQTYAPAKQLYDELQGDESLAAWLGIAGELYGDEVAELVRETLEQRYSAPEPPEPPSLDEPRGGLTPEERAAIEWSRNQMAETTYQEELARVKTFPEIGLDTSQKEAWFANFVAAADGDFDEAARRWKLSGMNQVTLPDPEPAPEPEPVVPAPATLGEGVTTPPVQPKFGSLDEALDSALDDMRAAREAPPAVGQV